MKKRHTPEQIVRRLREAQAELAAGVSYQVRPNSIAPLCHLRPPVVAGVRANDLGLIAQGHPTLHECLFEFLDILKEVAVRHRFVAQRPQPFGGL